VETVADKVKVNETFCRKVQPPEKGHVIHWDGAIDGFGLRVTAGGHRAFILDYYIFGKRHRYTIGKYPDDYSAEMARARALELRQGVREGRDPFAEKERMAQEAAEDAARGRTVAELATAYMKEHVHPYRRPKTEKDYQALIDNHIRPQLGRFRVGAVLRRDVTNLHVSLKGTPYLANRVLALLSAMYEWARTDDATGWGVEANPVEGIERYHEEQRVASLTLEQMARLLQALDQYPRRRVDGLVCSKKQKEYLRAEALRIAKAIHLLLLTGARKSEALGARWTEFDLDRGRWTKPSHRTKQQRTERGSINDEAVALLKSIPRDGDSEFVFPGRKPGEPLTDISTAWHEICEAAGITGLRLHDLRHNKASWATSEGEPLPMVGAMLDQSQLSTTLRYIHLQDQPLRDADNRFGKMVAGLRRHRRPTNKHKKPGRYQTAAHKPQTKRALPGAVNVGKALTISHPHGRRGTNG